MNKTLSIDDLPKYSSWPQAFIEMNTKKRKLKNLHELEREYEREKWGPLLKKVKSNPKLKIEDVDRMFHGNNPLLIYDHGKYKLLDPLECQNRYFDLFYKTTSRYFSGVKAIVEMSSGYGTMIIRMARRIKSKKIPVYATEFSASGRKLIKLISKAEKMNLADIAECDFFNPNITSMPIPKQSLIFTSYTTSVVPMLKDAFFQRLIDFQPKAVIHFEPMYEHNGVSTIRELMQKRYTVINDYNRNCLTLLKKFEKKGKIKIIEEKKTVFGTNPLFVVSIVVWKPIVHS